METVYKTEVKTVIVEPTDCYDDEISFEYEGSTIARFKSFWMISTRLIKI